VPTTKRAVTTAPSSRVDGVALKQAVNALAAAPAEEHAARFASAEVVRWLEWGMRSYHDLAFGFTLLLLAALFIRTAGLARPIGWLAGASGIAYLAQGWIAGAEGFTPAQSVAIVLGWVLNLAWIIWLSGSAIRKHREPIGPGAA
jgi:hypothetical protein